MNDKLRKVPENALESTTWKELKNWDELQTTNLKKSHRSRAKMYRAAFFVFLALLAGSGNNAGCNVSAKVERMADLFILKQAWIYFTPRVLLRGSLADLLSGLLINMQYVKRFCERIVYSLTEISCVPRGITGFGNFLNVTFVGKKIGSTREHYTSFPLVTRKCCHLLGKSIKDIKHI